MLNYHVEYHLSDAPHAMEFSPDARYFAALQLDGRLIVWNRNSTVSQIVLKTDAREIADQRTIPYADLVSANQRFVVHFSPDSRYVLVKEGDNLRIWDLRSQRELITIPKSLATASQVLFAADGASLFTQTPSGRFAQWDLQTGEELPLDFTFIPIQASSNVILSQQHDRVSMRQPEVIQVNWPKEFPGQFLDISPDGNFIITQQSGAAAFRSGGETEIDNPWMAATASITVWDSHTERKVLSISSVASAWFVGARAICALQVMPDDLVDRQLTCVLQWIGDPEPKTTLRTNPGSATISPNGHSVALRDEVGTLTLLSLSDRNIRKFFDPQQHYSVCINGCVRFSSSQNVLACLARWNRDQRIVSAVTIIDTLSGKPLSHIGHRIGIAIDGGQASLPDSASSQLPEVDFTSIALSPVDRVIAVGCNNGEVRFVKF